MINFLSSWTKNISLAIIVVSILEMLLPNNKTKKYIKMVMGIYILFSIISPFVSNKDTFNLESIDVDSDNFNQTANEKVNQDSMDKRLNEIYMEKLESDIKEKVTNKGYIVEECHVNADINNEKNDSQISKIRLIVEKSEETEEDTEKNETIEEKLVTEIQKIQKVDINLSKNNISESNAIASKNNTKITKTDIEIIKKFIVEEYGVSKSCLQIN